MLSISYFLVIKSNEEMVNYFMNDIVQVNQNIEEYNKYNEENGTGIPPIQKYKDVYKRQPEAPATPAVNSNGAVPEMNSPAMSTGTIMDIPAPVSYTHLDVYKSQVERYPKLNKDEPYIFVCNHTCPEDIETILNVLDRNAS